MILEHFVQNDPAADGYSRAVLHTTKNGIQMLARLVEQYLPEPHEASLIQALKSAMDVPQPFENQERKK